MWADQISSNDLGSIAGGSLKKEQSTTSLGRDASIKGYDAELVDESVAGPSQAVEEESAHTQAAPGAEGSDDAHDSPKVASAENEVANPVTNAAVPSQPIAFPSSQEDQDSKQDEATPSAPIAFPTETATPEKSAPAVTFGASALSPPKTGTPDPDSEPKRKRISSQNFQRLARRISITTRRQGSVSSMLPDILKRNESPRVSVDEGANATSPPRGEGSSSGAANESPAASLRDEPEGSKLKRKVKKDKKKKDSV